jgi:hypothetical protein
LPFKVRTHFPLHLVNLSKREHALASDAPGLVGVCIIANDLGSNHECRDGEDHEPERPEEIRKSVPQDLRYQPSLVEGRGLEG